MPNLTSLHTITSAMIDANSFVSTTAKQTRLFAVHPNYKKSKKKIIINYSDGSEFTVKNAIGFTIENGLIAIGIKSHKVHIDKGITKHVGSSSLTIKEHLVDSLVEIDYDSIGNKVVKETQIKGKSYFDKK